MFQVSILLYFTATKIKDLFQDISRMTGNDSVKFEILGYFVVFIKAENILLDSVDLIKIPIYVKESKHVNFYLSQKITVIHILLLL